MGSKEKGGGTTTDTDHVHGAILMISETLELFGLRNMPECMSGNDPYHHSSCENSLFTLYISLDMR